jgi:hypothetical protein
MQHCLLLLPHLIDLIDLHVDVEHKSRFIRMLVLKQRSVRLQLSFAL